MGRQEVRQTKRIRLREIERERDGGRIGER